jgi:hypothetical protein
MHPAYPDIGAGGQSGHIGKLRLQPVRRTEQVCLAANREETHRQDCEGEYDKYPKPNDSRHNVSLRMLKKLFYKLDIALLKVVECAFDDDIALIQ